MSLVGPRPEDPRYVAGYTAEQRHVLSVRPGITSPASIAYRDEERLIRAHGGDVATVYREEILPAKLAIDLDYGATALVVGGPRGVDQNRVRRIRGTSPVELSHPAS